MATCTYTSLFKLQIWDYYRLVPHQQSDANSIMFSANYLCRLAAPLSYNFLQLTRQSESAKAFTAVMGEMDGYFSLGKNFMYLFPVFVAIFCLCSLLNVWQRMFRSAFMKNLFTSCWPLKKLKIHIDDPRQLMEEGAAILKHERDTREENNTGVTFDSVGDISDNNAPGRNSPHLGINKLPHPGDRTSRLPPGVREPPSLRDPIGRDSFHAGRDPIGRDSFHAGRDPIGRDSMRESVLRGDVARDSIRESNLATGRPKFSFADKNNRYSKLHNSDDGGS